MGVVDTGNNVMFKVKCSHNGLTQASGQCDYRATLTMTVPVQFCIVFPVMCVSGLMEVLLIVPRL